MYRRFGWMVAVSTVVMYGLMYLNTFSFDHVWFSQTRAWMAVVMGATMAPIMLGFMLQMYPNNGANVAVVAGSMIAFACAQSGNRDRRVLREGHDPPSFHRHHA